MGAGAKNILVTGGARGLGRASALELARQGHRVLLTARTVEQARAVASELARESGGAVEGFAVELSSLDSVRALGDALLEKKVELDVLMNVAGVMQQSPERRVTGDGFEETLAVNVLAPFLLTARVWPLLGRGARVVNVSSRLHLPGSRGVTVDFDFEDPQLERGYHPERAYKNSKLALLWFTLELARRAKQRGVLVNAVCPGFVPTTASASTHGFQRFLLAHVLVHMPFATSVADATSSLCFMAVDPAVEGVSGAFWAEKQQTAPSADALDPAKAARFWKLAAEWTRCAPDWPEPAGAPAE